MRFFLFLIVLVISLALNPVHASECLYTLAALNPVATALQNLQVTSNSCLNTTTASNLVTKPQLDAGLAPLATAAGLTAAIAPLATSPGLIAAVAPLATSSNLTAAVAPLATSAALTAAVAPLATSAALAVQYQSLRDQVQTSEDSTYALLNSVSCAQTNLAANVTTIVNDIATLKSTTSGLATSSSLSTVQNSLTSLDSFSRSALVNVTFFTAQLVPLAKSVDMLATKDLVLTIISTMASAQNMTSLSDKLDSNIQSVATVQSAVNDLTSQVASLLVKVNLILGIVQSHSGLTGPSA